ESCCTCSAWPTVPSSACSMGPACAPSAQAHSVTWGSSGTGSSSTAGKGTNGGLLNSDKCAQTRHFRAGNVPHASAAQSRPVAVECHLFPIQQTTASSIHPIKPGRASMHGSSAASLSAQSGQRLNNPNDH